MQPAKSEAVRLHNTATLQMIAAMDAMRYRDEAGRTEFDAKIEAATKAEIDRYVDYFNSGYNASAGLKTQMASFVSGLGNENWMSAGAIYMHAGRAASAASDAANAAPAASGGGIIINGKHQFTGGAGNGVRDTFVAVGDKIAEWYNGSKVEKIVDAIGETGGMGWDLLRGNTDELQARMLDRFSGGMDKAHAQASGGGNINPIMAMKKLGDDLIISAVAIWLAVSAVFIALGALATNVAVAAVGGVGAFMAAGTLLGGLVAVLMSAMLGIGITLAIYLPMVPYILWISAVAGWLIFTFEAVLAAPILALAFAHPDGHDAFGKGEVGIMMLVSLVFRPVLMVFSFVGAMIISGVLAGFVNATYFELVESTQSAAGTFTGVISSLGFLGIYLAVMMQVIHKSFSMIHVVPDKVMTWVGGHTTGHADGGDEQKVGASVAGGVSSSKGAVGKPQRQTGGGGGKDKGGGKGGGGAGGAPKNGDHI